MKSINKVILFTAPILFAVLNFAYAQSAYELAMRELQNKGAVSCNPDEAYNLILSRDAGGRSSGLSLKVKPRLDPKSQMFIDGIDPELACRIAALMKADPKIGIIHGYRSVSDQRRLCGISGKPSGCAAPGRSCHNLGLAADLAFPSNYSRAYRQSLLSKFKLHLAYSSNAHVQCVEHKKANVNSCNTPCARAGIAISQNGSGEQAESLSTQQNTVDQQGVPANNSPVQERGPEPVYGQHQSQYSNIGNYQYANGEAWEGVDSSELNGYDNWWSKYVSDNTEIEWGDYQDTRSSVFDNGSTSTGLVDSYSPTLGFIGTNNESVTQTNKVDAGSTQIHYPDARQIPESATNTMEKSALFARPSRSVSDSSPKEAGFVSSLIDNNSIVDYFIVNTQPPDLSQGVYTHGTKEQNNNIIQSALSWFINDDERRLNQGINQDIYNPNLSNNQSTSSDFADKISQIQVTDTKSDSSPDTNLVFRDIFSKTLDLSLFFSFPVLPIFTF